MKLITTFDVKNSLDVWAKFLGRVGIVLPKGGGMLIYLFSFVSNHIGPLLTLSRVVYLGQKPPTKKIRIFVTNLERGHPFWEIQREFQKIQRNIGLDLFRS